MSVTVSDARLDPPAFLQLAGHPLRWRLLGELALSDRLVQELTALVGEPQNLVSYHLGKLREARLVTPRRSDADKRDAYYGLDLSRIGALLAATGAALHPGLQLKPQPPQDAPARTAKILFLCSGNSARSQMAEAIAQSRSGGAIQAFSAGSHPRPLHPNAVRVMKEMHGLDLQGRASKQFGVFAKRRFDWVISLCDRVREICPDFPNRPNVIHWSIANPATGAADRATYPLFRQTAAELTTRIDFLRAVIADRARKPRRKP